MDSVLLSAGLGTRLRPLTDVLPKCLAPIRGRPLIEYWLNLVLRSPTARVLVNTHAHASLVTAYISECAWADRIDVVHEEALLGTGGTLAANFAFAGNKPVLVAHADNLSLFDPQQFIAAHAKRPRGTALTMMTFTANEPESCGIVATDPQGVVSGFFEKIRNPPGNRANAAVYVMEPEVLRFIQSLGKSFVDLSTEVLPHFVGRMATWHNGVYHRDIGTLASWRSAQTDYPGPPLALPRPDSWTRLLKRAPEIEAQIGKLLPGDRGG